MEDTDQKLQLNSKCHSLQYWLFISVMSRPGLGLDQNATCRLMNRRVKKNQLDAQLILSIFRQPLHKNNNNYQMLYTYGCTS